MIASVIAEPGDEAGSILFAFQGEQILKQPLVIVLLAVPILIQVFLNALRTWRTARSARTTVLLVLRGVNSSKRWHEAGTRAA